MSMGENQALLDAVDGMLRPDVTHNRDLIRKAAGRAAAKIRARVLESMPIYDSPDEEWLAAVIGEEFGV